MQRTKGYQIGFQEGLKFNKNSDLDSVFPPNIKVVYLMSNEKVKKDPEIELAKEWLLLYRPLKARMVRLEKETARAEKTLLANPDIRGINYDSICTSCTYAVSNIVEQQVLDTIEKYELKKAETEVIAGILEDIECTVNITLRQLQRRIIRLRYLNDERISWESIAEIVGKNDNHIRHDLHKKALKEIYKAIKDIDISVFK